MAGRPKIEDKKKPVTICLTDTLKARLQEKATKDNRSLSSYVEQIILKAIRK